MFLLTLAPFLFLQTPQDNWVCEADLIFQGKPAQHLGWSLSASGNWNRSEADQASDILAGSFGVIDETDLFDHVGRVELYLSPYPWSVGKTSCPPHEGATGVRINSTKPAGDRFGQTVSYIGDVDGDGRDDFVAAAVRGPYVEGLEEPWTENGSLYVFLSSDEGTGFHPDTVAAGTTTEASASDASLIVVNSGEGRVGDRLGTALAAIGDLDADGTPDFVAGAPGSYRSAVDYPGRAYVLSGAAILAAYEADLGVVDVLEVSDAVLQGDGADGVPDRFGYSVAALGDAGGFPGESDFAVGAPQFTITPSGLAHQGGHGYVTVYDNQARTGRRFDGARPDDRFGFSVGQGANVGGKDALNELIVGAPLWDLVKADGSVVPDVGRVYIYDARTSRSVLPNEVVMRGLQAGERFGHYVSGIPDVGGSALGDLVVGSHRANTALTQYLPEAYPCQCDEPSTNPDDLKLGGGSAGSVRVFTRLTKVQSQRFLGESQRDSAGIPTVVAQGVGPNGEDAMVIGGPRWPDVTEINGVEVKESGRVYVFLIDG